MCTFNTTKMVNRIYSISDVNGTEPQVIFIFKAAIGINDIL